MKVVLIDFREAMEFVESRVKITDSEAIILTQYLAKSVFNPLLLEEQEIVDSILQDNYLEDLFSDPLGLEIQNQILACVCPVLGMPSYLLSSLKIKTDPYFMNDTEMLVCL